MDITAESAKKAQNEAEWAYDKAMTKIAELYGLVLSDLDISKIHK